MRHHLIAAFAWSSAADRVCRRGLGAALSHHRPGQLRHFDLDLHARLSDHRRHGIDLGRTASAAAILRVIPELLRPLADYIELIFCVLVVATLTFFPDGIASAVWRAAGRRSDAEPGAASRRPKSSGTLAELLSPTGSVADASRDQHRPVAHRFCSSRASSKSYGALRAVDNVSLAVAPRALHGLDGSERRGQDDAVQHRLRLRSGGPGNVRMSGAPLDPVPIERRIGLGMTRTFQHAAVFQRLSCLDNVIIGLGRNGDRGRARLRSIGAGVRHCRQRVRARARRWPHSRPSALARGPRRLPAALSLGDQRRLEIARAIVSRPQHHPARRAGFGRMRSRKRTGCVSSCSRSIGSSASPW